MVYELVVGILDLSSPGAWIVVPLSSKGHGYVANIVPFSPTELVIVGGSY